MISDIPTSRQNLVQIEYLNPSRLLPVRGPHARFKGHVYNQRQAPPAPYTAIRYSLFRFSRCLVDSPQDKVLNGGEGGQKKGDDYWKVSVAYVGTAYRATGVFIVGRG